MSYEDFIINTQTNANSLSDYLYDKVESYYGYGSENTFTYILESILTKSLITNQLDEDEASEISHNFIDKNFTTDSTSIPDEYDSYGRTYKGWVKFNGDEIFTWQSGGDGHGFGGSIEKEEVLLKGLQDFLENCSEIQKKNKFYS